VSEITYLIGTDIGTLGTKTVLVDLDGNLISQAYMEYDVITPCQGWAEQWPSIWAKAAFWTIKETINRSKIDPGNVNGLAISSLYGGSGIPIDRKMNPIRPCIIWADRRATKECRWIKEEIGQKPIFEITGNVIDPYYGFTKMLWIKRNEPKNWKKIYRFETPNSYCIRLITGEENIDYSSAGNYGGIFNIHKRFWSEEMMEELGIPKDFFPSNILSSEEIVGEITREGSNLTGLKVGTPVCAGGIDASISALAGGALNHGDLASMLGTSMCNGFISHEPKYSPKMITFPYVVNGRKFLSSFTGISTAGFSVRWFRDQLGREEINIGKELNISPYRLLDEKAKEIPIGSDNLLFLPHLMIGERAPYWDDYLRGGFIGLTVYHTRAHLFRAILEGVAYAMKYSIEAASETGIKINRATLVNGGARSPLWRQIISDVVGIEMSYIPNSKEAPIGDAILAGFGTRVLRDHSVIEEWIGEKVSIIPNIDNFEKYEKFYKLYKRILKQLKPIYKVL
jgi:xylulokinase